MHRFLELDYLINKRLILYWKYFYSISLILKFLVFVTWMVLFIRFFYLIHIVSGASMEPTFHQGFLLLLIRLHQNLKHLRDGDIIVFVPKWKNVPYIKRTTIGLPWETVKIQDNKCLFVIIKESFVKLQNHIYLMIIIPKQKCWKNNFVRR